jgi:proline iminopeptidase
MKKYLLAFLCSAMAVVAFGQTDSLYVTTSDSVKLFVQKRGHGYPVLFIHGGPGSHSAYFQYCGGAVFEKDVQMIYLDQRGCGRSQNAANKDYSMARLVKDFEEVRVALGFRKWMIMPHSFGGTMATEYAFRHLSSLKAIIYLNSTLNIDSSATSGLLKTKQLLNAHNIVVPELDDLNLPLMDRWGRGFGKLQEIDMFYAMMFDTKQNFLYHDSVTQRYAHSREFAQLVWGYPEYFRDFTVRTSQIKLPVLVIGGTRDYTIGVSHPNLMKFPHMETKLIGGGHALYMEHTRELYEAVAPFLKKQSEQRD